MGGTINIFKSTDINEIANSWLCYKKLINRSFDKYTTQEFLNGVERFMIAVANDENIDKVKNKFNSEMVDKKIKLEDNFIDKLYDCLIKSGNEKQDIIYNYSDGNFNIYVNNKQLSTKLLTERYQFLTSRTTIDNLAWLLLKYDLIGGMRGQHWCIPAEVYLQLIKAYDIKVEGFASPINTQLMMLRKDANFCSIFDTDSIVGSYGSFFKAFEKGLFKGKNITVNPPYIETIMEEAAKVALKHDGVSIFYGPLWTDAAFYKILTNAKVHKQILKKYEHYYTDYKGRKIVSKFDSVVFIINTDSPINITYTMDSM